jgi:ribosomal protein S18 acetylase RimI-like enzyme
MRQASLDDLTEILEVYSACRTQLVHQNIDQWAHGYPSQDIVITDIDNLELWVREEKGTIIGVVALNQSAAERYNLLTWVCQGITHYEVHRLAVHPLQANKGIGSAIMRWAEEKAQRRNACCIRLDTYSRNAANIGLYRKLGYRSIENEIFWPPLDFPFVCFEKLLE